MGSQNGKCGQGRQVERSFTKRARGHVNTDHSRVKWQQKSGTVKGGGASLSLVSRLRSDMSSQRENVVSVQ